MSTNTSVHTHSHSLTHTQNTRNGNCPLYCITHMQWICSASVPTSFLWVHSWQLYDSMKATSTACTASTQWSGYTHLFLPPCQLWTMPREIFVYNDRLGALVIGPTALLLSPSDDVMLYMELLPLISDTQLGQVHLQWKLKRPTEPRLLYNIK